MQLTVYLLLAFAAVAYGASLPLNESVEGWHVPNVDGTFRWVSKAQYEQESRNIEPRAYSVKFYLYTKSNPTSGKQITVNDATALSSSNFNKANPTRFIIHGWQNTYTSSVNTILRDAWLSKGQFNIFCVDWSSAAGTVNYNAARNAVAEVGQMVANYIDFLNKNGMSFSTLKVMGHSLGAHVSGFAGKKVTKGKIGTIIGLDPANPLFSYSDCKTRLCNTDATYVESIQTNGGELGFLEPIGKAAFYPNGGKVQPGCGVDASGSCAHSRSYIYLGEAIKKDNFKTYKCSSYTDAVNNKCGSSYGSVKMGSPSNTGISGYYYVPVKSSSPYGSG